MLRRIVPILALALLAASTLGQAAEPRAAKSDGGPAARPRTRTDREVIDDLELLSNLDVLRDLEMYAPTDGGAAP